MMVMAERETKIDQIDPEPTKGQKDRVPKERQEGTSSSQIRPEVKESRMKKRSVIMVGLLGLLILGGAGGAAVHFGYLSIPGLSATNRPEPAPPPKPEMGETLKFTPLIINLNEETGRSYLKTTIVLELENKKLVETIQARMSVFTDTVILTISDKKLEDLKTNDFKDRLKGELMSRFNDLLGQKGIRGIYFDEFLFQ